MNPGATSAGGPRSSGARPRRAALADRIQTVFNERTRPWWSAALAAVGLLVVPFFVWLILPAPPKIPLPQVGAAPAEEPPPLPRPTPASPPPATPRSPPPAETAASEEAAIPVKGRVLGPDGAGVQRARVVCNDREIFTVTEHDGSFELPAAAAGCSAVARFPGFGASPAVTLQPGDARGNTLELRGGGKIAGVVVDEKGAPVTKFQLAVEKFLGGDGDDEGSHGRARTVEDPEGRFTMESATPGRYILGVAAEGRPPARSEVIDVEPGRTVSGVRIVLPRGAILSGVITDAETRKPIEGAQVGLDSVSQSGVSSVRSVRSDERGAYRLEGVPTTGPFSIRVHKDGYRTRLVSGLVAYGGGPATSDVQLQPGSGTEGAESELGGIGAVLAPHPSALGALVVSVTPKGPAERAGLQKSDWIVRIDGVSTETMTLVDCIQRLRGQPGTRVSVVVKRDGRDLSFDLTRENVVVSRPGRN